MFDFFKQLIVSVAVFLGLASQPAVEVAIEELVKQAVIEKPAPPKPMQTLDKFMQPLAVGGAALSAEDTKLKEIADEQTDYFNLNGKYKQGKGEFGTDPKYRYSITEYSGPKGKGYDIHLVKHTSTTTVEEKHINIGPETYRNQNWVVTYPYPGRPYNASSTNP